MAGASFRTNLGNLQQRMGLAISKAQQTQRLTKAIGEMMVSSTLQRFEDEKSPQGEAWEPSERATEEGGKTLVDTARLRNSIVFETSQDMVIVGSNTIYARIHQFGGKAGKGQSVELPARPYLGISEEDEKDIQALILDHIKDVFR